MAYMKSSEDIKKDIKLYNIIFPIWLLWLFPQILIFILPANFLIDSLVLLITMSIFKIGFNKKIYKKSILKIWGFGFLADIIGTIFMIIPIIIDNFLDTNTAFERWWYDNLTTTIGINPFKSIFAIIWVLIAILISAICIYQFNYRFSFKKVELDLENKKKLALSLAIFTAPYLFLLPTEWFYY